MSTYSLPTVRCLPSHPQHLPISSPAYHQMCPAQTWKYIQFINHFLIMVHVQAAYDAPPAKHQMCSAQTCKYMQFINHLLIKVHMYGTHEGCPHCAACPPPPPPSPPHLPPAPPAYHQMCSAQTWKYMQFIKHFLVLTEMQAAHTALLTLFPLTHLLLQQVSFASF